MSLFLFLYLKERKNNKAILANTIKLLLHQEQQHEVNKTDEEKSNEAFLKFVSDSRDWAYQYIEEVQSGLKSFIDEVEPQIDYYNHYGAAVEGMMAPHDFAMKKISSEFKKLKNLLPEDYDKL
jgi:uncharacterized protein (DUF2164 family)